MRKETHSGSMTVLSNAHRKNFRNIVSVIRIDVVVGSGWCTHAFIAGLVRKHVCKETLEILSC
jgi:hypothetical protein